MAAIEQLYAEPKQEAPARKRIRRLSAPFELIFAVLAALVAAVYVATLLVGLFYSGEHFRLTDQGPTLYLGQDTFAPGSIAISDVPLAARLIGFIPLTIIQGALVGAFYC
ncbi:MAG: hypothetical protein KBF30_01150, partial [Hyphomonadaceae bacterium]|nr:hypothetical protein [Hyphomonadaceae bacterium]